MSARQSVITALRWDPLAAVCRLVHEGGDVGPADRRVDTGYVWVNGTGKHFLGAPFSEHRNSGTDSEESIEELLSYTQLKTVNIAF